jgi:CheY-like chemotaxis protein
MRQLVLADDSTTIQKVIQLSFAEEDFEIQTFSNGTGALEHIRNYGSDIVLADISLPHLDGYDLCREIRQDPRTAMLPVILLAGTFEPFDAERALEVGYTSLLVKPFETGKLVDLVKKLVSRGGHVKRTGQKVDPRKEDSSEPLETGQTTPVPGPSGSPLPIKLPVPPARGKIRFELSPTQCRIEATGTRSAAMIAELSSEQLDDLVQKVLERLPETLRTLVPEIAKKVLDTPSGQTDDAGGETLPE